MLWQPATSGWGFEHFCDLICGRNKIPTVIKSGLFHEGTRNKKSFQLVTLPDIHAQHRKQRVPVTVFTDKGDSSKCVKDQRIRRCQQHNEHSMLNKKLRLNHRLTAGLAIDRDILKHVCLSVYPVWKQLQSYFKSSSNRRCNRAPALCKVRKFCHFVNKCAGVTREDAIWESHVPSTKIVVQWMVSTSPDFWKL